MTDPKVTVYTMEFCPYCIKAKALLTDKSVPFKEIKVADDDDAMWDSLYKKSGMKTMPQIFSGDTCIGGYTDLAALNAKEGLKSLL